MEPMYSETEDVKQRRQDKDAPKTDEGVINQDNGRRGRKGKRHLGQSGGSKGRALCIDAKTGKTLKQVMRPQ